MIEIMRRYGLKPAEVETRKIALSAFANALPHPEAANAATCSRPISLAGLALLWSGLSDDVSIIHRSSLVIRPDNRPSAPLD